MCVSALCCLCFLVSWTYNCAHSSYSTQRRHPKSTKVKSHGNNVHDVFIAHVISGDAESHKHTDMEIQKPTGRELRTWLVGKKWAWMDDAVWQIWYVLREKLPSLTLAFCTVSEKCLRWRPGNEATVHYLHLGNVLSLHSVICELVTPVNHCCVACSQHEICFLPSATKTLFIRTPSPSWIIG